MTNPPVVSTPSPWASRLRTCSFAFLMLAAVLLGTVLIASLAARAYPATFSVSPAAAAILAPVGMALLLLATHLRQGRDCRPSRILWGAVLSLLVLQPYVATLQTRQDWSYLIRFGALFEARAVPALKQTPHYVHRLPPGQPLHAGYDGQFYAQVALDPLLTEPADLQAACDAPSYRAQRMLLPALAYVIGAGQPRWILPAYALLNLGFWLLLLVVLLRRARLTPFGARAALAVAGICLSFGVTESMAQSLPDLPAAALLLVAVLAGPMRGSLAVAAAGLARNTGVLGLAGLLTIRLDRESLSRNLKATLLAIVPVALWYGYVVRRLGVHSFWGQDNIGWPLVAFIERFGRAVAEADLTRLTLGNLAALLAYDQPAHELIAMVSLAIQAAYLLALAPRGRGAGWPAPLVRVGLAFAVLAACLGSNVWYSTEAAARALLPLTVAFNLLLAQRRRALFVPLFVLGNLHSVYSVWMLYSVGGPW